MKRRVSKWRMARRSASLCSLLATSGWAQDAGAPVSASAPPAVGAAPARRRLGPCVEHVPEGKARPPTEESFPARGKAGYAAVLRVTIQHGKGETVLPGGFKLQLDAPEARAIQAASFVIAAPEGPFAPVVKRTDGANESSTTVELSFVPLPKEPGRQQLTLPSVPLALARASGEIVTLCTEPHTIEVEDPTANTPSAKPRHNPPPRQQLEVWTAAKNVVLGALAALPLGALIAFLVTRWLRRARPLPPPPPPRPPWEVALEALAEVRRKDLVARGRATEHFAEVSSAVRRYLGDVYGFDGLERTTAETLADLGQAPARGRVRPSPGVFEQVERFLRRADLVKFANLSPTEAECVGALETAEAIVRQTMIEARPPASTPDAAGAEPGPPEPPPPPPPPSPPGASGGTPPREGSS